MTRKEALTELLEKVESGKIGAGLNTSSVFEKGADLDAVEAFHGSLDAAVALHEAVLPGWDVTGLDQASNLAGSPWGCEVAYFDGGNLSKTRRAYSRHDYENPARAWLIAILKALIETEGE